MAIIADSLLVDQSSTPPPDATSGRNNSESTRPNDADPFKKVNVEQWILELRDRRTRENALQRLSKVMIIYIFFFLFRMFLHVIYIYFLECFVHDPCRWKWFHAINSIINFQAAKMALHVMFAVYICRVLWWFF